MTPIVLSTLSDKPFDVRIQPERVSYKVQIAVSPLWYPQSLQAIHESMTKDYIKGLPKVHKATKNWGLSETSLLDDCSKSKNVVGGTVVSPKIGLSSGSKSSLIKHTGDVILKYRGIELS